MEYLEVVADTQDLQPPRGVAGDHLHCTTSDYLAQHAALRQ